MRLLLLSTFAVCLACNAQGVPRLPPADGFYYPTGITHVSDSSSPEGFLYVANANFDRRFDYGSVMAVELSALNPPLPGFGVVPDRPVDIRELNRGPGTQVLIQSFAGEMEKRVEGSDARLFIPSRGEGSYLYSLRASTSGTLDCDNGQPAPGAPAGTAADCSTRGPSQSLTANEQSTATGKPRAPEPYGVGISPDNSEVFVTHLRAADSPVGSATNLENYVVRFPGDGAVTDASYVSLGNGAASSVAVGVKYAYVTGRFLNPRGYVLRLVKRTGAGEAPIVLNPFIEASFLVSEARGIAINTPVPPDPRTSEDRAFILARGPDTLFVVSIEGAETDNPVLTLVRAVPLPAGANEIKLIQRPGRGTLAVITCSTANMVVLYDDDIGQLVSLITDVGVQPFGLAWASQPSGGARIFVSTFGDGRISVLDLPDLAQPQNLWLVARIGRPQVCVTQPTDPACAESSP